MKLKIFLVFVIVIFVFDISSSTQIEIEYKEIPRIYSKDIEDIIDGYKNLQMNDEQIISLHNEIMKLYSGKGYIMTRVYIDKTAMDNGVLLFVVKDGYVEDIVFKRESGRKYSPFSQSLQRLSFGWGLKNYLLNIKDLDQGLQQINRLATANSTLEIVSSDKQGYSIVEITNKAKNRFVACFGLDNSGSKDTGIYRSNTSISSDNLLMLNDNIYFNYSKDINGNDDKGTNNSYYAALEIPFGYLTMRGTFFNTDSASSIGTSYGDYISDGSNQDAGVSLEAVIKREQNYNFSLASQLNLKETQNSFGGEIIDVSSKKLAVATESLIGSFSFEKSSLYSKLSYVKGLDSFDVVRNSNIEGSPKGQFDAYAFYGQYSLMFFAPLIKKSANYFFVLNAQYCPDILYSSEQMAIGGLNSVRGFSQNSINADSAIYFRNDISWVLWDKIKNLRANIFFDYGYAILNAEQSHKQISGSGTGLAYKMKQFTASFIWSRSVRNLSDLDDEGNVFYISAQWSFWI
jgi:hemolysin activation/secretion protein